MIQGIMKLLDKEDTGLLIIDVQEKLMTCVSVLERGYNVHVPLDAVDSRTNENWRVGLKLMERAGAVITSTEAVVYQLLKKAGTKEFNKILKLIR
jgi:nicotinamidase-related amidase